jgi:hypothetical protein
MLQLAGVHADTSAIDGACEVLSVGRDIEVLGCDEEIRSRVGIAEMRAEQSRVGGRTPGMDSQTPVNRTKI